MNLLVKAFCYCVLARIISHNMAIAYVCCWIYFLHIFFSFCAFCEQTIKCIIQKTMKYRNSTLKNGWWLCDVAMQSVPSSHAQQIKWKTWTNKIRQKCTERKVKHHKQNNKQKLFASTLVTIATSTHIHLYTNIIGCAIQWKWKYNSRRSRNSLPTIYSICIKW